MNYATIGEAIFLKAMAHNLVVVMGINANIVSLCEAPVKDVVQYSSMSWQSCNTMDYIVRVAIKPLPFIDFCVCSLRTWHESECCYWLVILNDKIVEAIGYVFLPLSIRDKTVRKSDCVDLRMILFAFMISYLIL